MVNHVKFVRTFLRVVASFIYLDSSLKYQFSCFDNCANIHKWIFHYEEITFTNSTEAHTLLFAFKWLQTVCIISEWILYNFYCNQSSKMKLIEFQLNCMAANDINDHWCVNANYIIDTLLILMSTQWAQWVKWTS